MGERWQRETLYGILRELRVDQLARAHQDALMTALGFEEDVAFAKSLFSHKLAHIYRELDGQFEKFTAGDAVSALPTEPRRFLMAVFRRLHEERLSSSGREREGELAGLRLPNPHCIEEVVAFQKRMYELFRHLVPPTPPHAYFPLQKFAPFPIFPPERPHFTHNYHPDRHSFLNRLPSFPEDRPDAPTGAFSSFEEAFPPTKRLKREENVNFAPSNVETMRRELEMLEKSRRAQQTDRTTLAVPRRESEQQQQQQQQQPSHEEEE